MSALSLMHSVRPFADGWWQIFGKFLAAARENPHTLSNAVLTLPDRPLAEILLDFQSQARNSGPTGLNQIMI
jgi:hypothetical protein